MGFEIRVNGEAVHELDMDVRLVNRVKLRTSRGESSAAYIDMNQNYVDLDFEYRSHTDLAVRENDEMRQREEEALAAPLYPNENNKRLEADRNNFSEDEIQEVAEDHDIDLHAPLGTPDTGAFGGGEDEKAEILEKTGNEEDVENIDGVEYDDDQTDQEIREPVEDPESEDPKLTL